MTMQKITLSLDDETYRRVRIEAAKAGKSMSRWLSEFIEEERRREEALAQRAAEAGDEAVESERSK
jgi:plasmid stability protein